MASQITEIEHVDGIWWYEAPRPRRWHRCKPWTSGWMDLFGRVDRCACGAIRYNGRGWIERNSRRKDA
jgi:hypothetical protein